MLDQILTYMSMLIVIFFLYYFSSFLNLIIYVSKTRLSQFYKYHLGRNQLTVIIKVYFSPNVSLLSASRDRFW